MKYKFKVGELVRDISSGKEMKVYSLTTWRFSPAYRIVIKNNSYGIWLETEIEAIEPQKETTTSSDKQVGTKTMWALVLKSAPKVLNYTDDLFMTRAEARKEKSKEDLTAYKVVKVKLTWED